MCVASRRAKKHASGIGTHCGEKHAAIGATLEPDVDIDYVWFLN